MNCCGEWAVEKWFEARFKFMSESLAILCNSSVLCNCFDVFEGAGATTTLNDSHEIGSIAISREVVVESGASVLMSSLFGTAQYGVTEGAVHVKGTTLNDQRIPRSPKSYKMPHHKIKIGQNLMSHALMPHTLTGATLCCA